MIALQLRAAALANALGVDTASILDAVFSGSQRFAAPRAFHVPFPTVVGEVALKDAPPARSDASDASRIIRLLRPAISELSTAISEMRVRFGRDRIGIVLGTCTGGLDSTERAYATLAAGGKPAGYSFDREHALHHACDWVAEVTGISGPAQVISTACSSSAKAVAVAQRWVQFGVVDGVLILGADTLTLTTLHGFSSLASLASDGCRPFAVDRAGITLAEGAAAILVDGDPTRRATVQIVGVGESSDGYHQTAPEPTGAGAKAAMRAALGEFGGTIGAINAHATATVQNDAVEALAIAAVAAGVPVSATKGVTGHLLGAAGLTEVILAAATLERGALPPTALPADAEVIDGIDLVRAPRPFVGAPASIRAVLSNSFGFGGTNVAIVVADDARVAPAPTEGLPNVKLVSTAFFSPEFASLDDLVAGKRRASVQPAFRLIPGRQRRFTSLLTQMQLEVVEEALASAGVDPRTVPSVFASTYGELSTTIELLEAIEAGRPTSPARFAQSVHNTASGAFSVATQNTEPSSVVAGGPFLLAQALLEGVLLVGALQKPVVVAVGDDEIPALFRGESTRGTPPYAIAFVLAPATSAEFRLASSGRSQRTPRRLPLRGRTRDALVGALPQAHALLARSAGDSLSAVLALSADWTLEVRRG